MQIWLDDMRPIPDDGGDWIHVENAKDFKFYVENFQHNITKISFDHDLGLTEPTGYDLATWLEEKMALGKIKFLHDVEFTVHSANPIGAARIDQTIESMKRFL